MDLHSCFDGRSDELNALPPSQRFLFFVLLKVAETFDPRCGWLAGRTKGGIRPLSKRKLALLSGICPSTIHNGLRALVEAGLVQTLVGRCYAIRDWGKWSSVASEISWASLCLMPSRPEVECAYCRNPLSVVDAEVDHRLPLSRGGGDTPDNLALACRSCNQRKHTLTAEEFIAQEA